MLFIRDVKGIWLGEGLIKELVGEGWKSKTSTKFFSCVNWIFYYYCYYFLLFAEEVSEES